MDMYIPYMWPVSVLHSVHNQTHADSMRCMNRNTEDQCHWNLNEELKWKAERTGNMKNCQEIQMNWMKQAMLSPYKTNGKKLSIIRSTANSVWTLWQLFHCCIRSNLKGKGKRHGAWLISRDKMQRKICNWALKGFAIQRDSGGRTKRMEIQYSIWLSSTRYVIMSPLCFLSLEIRPETAMK